MTGRITVEIDELVLDGVEDGIPAAQLVQAEVARALSRQALGRQAQPALDGRVATVAAEVGRAVERSLNP